MNVVVTYGEDRHARVTGNADWPTQQGGYVVLSFAHMVDAALVTARVRSLEAAVHPVEIWLACRRCAFYVPAIAAGLSSRVLTFSTECLSSATWVMHMWTVAEREDVRSRSACRSVWASQFEMCSAPVTAEWVDTRVGFTGMSHAYLCRRPRGCTVHAILTHAIEWLDAFHGAAWIAEVPTLWAAGEALRGDATLEEYGLDDETPVELRGTWWSPLESI